MHVVLSRLLSKHMAVVLLEHHCIHAAACVEGQLSGGVA